MKTRIITSLLILLVVLPPILLGGWLLEILAFFIIAMATIEWMQNGTSFERWKYVVIPVIVIWVLLQGNLPQYWMALFSAGLILVWSFPVYMEGFSENDCFMALSLMFIVAMAYDGIQAMLPFHLYLMTICLANYGSDTGAYFFGRFFGRHKMAPVISPKKTWEGFFGGWLVGSLMAFLISLLYVNQLNYGLNLTLCLVCPVFAALGDLCFSCFKRAKNIKDFSSFLPGHGGLLDRLDSLIMNLILFNVLQIFFLGGL